VIISHHNTHYPTRNKADRDYFTVFSWRQNGNCYYSNVNYGSRNIVASTIDVMACTHGKSKVVGR